MSTSPRLKNCSHSAWLFDQLYTFRSRGFQCDSTVVTEDGMRFDVHKVVLASCSAWFLGRFCLVTERETSVPVPWSYFAVVLEYAYARQFAVPEAQRQGIVEVAKTLRMRELLQLLEQGQGDASVHQQDQLFLVSRTSDDALKSLRVLFEAGALCDIMLHSTSESDRLCIPVHRVILAACVDFFANKLPQCQANAWVVNGVPDKLLKPFLAYLYTGEFEMSTMHEWKEVALFATYLGCTTLVGLCCRFLETRLSLDDVVQAFRCARKTGSIPLIQSVHAVVGRPDVFRSFSDSEDFLDLDADEIAEILQEDTLSSFSEETLFDIALRWILWERDNRALVAGTVMSAIRFSCIHPDALDRVLAKAHFLRKDSSFYKQIEFAKEYHRDPEWQHLNHHRNNRQTWIRGATESLVVLGGCCLTPEALIAGDVLSAEVTTLRHNQDTWTSLTKMPLSIVHGSKVRGLQYASVAVLDNFLYVAGGFHDSGDCGDHVDCTDIVMRFDPRISVWHRVCNMLSARRHFQLVAVNGYLYALGGTVFRDPYKSVERYAPSQRFWQHVSPLMEDPDAFAAVSLAGWLMISGGREFGMAAAVRRVQVLDPYTGCWDDRCAMWTPRANHNMVATSRYIYVLGGEVQFTDDAAPFALTLVERYDPFPDQWTVVPGDMLPRLEAAAAVVNDDIYLVGGYDPAEPFIPSETVQVYSTREQTWRLAANMLRGLIGACASSLIIRDSHLL
ncbi:kelch-like protein 26 [Branchiostoma floridae x Branchiostoma belcheri]